MAKSSRNSLGKIVASKRSPILENGKVPSRQRTTRSSAPRSRSTLGSALPPRRQLNADRRSREYLTPDEVEKVLQAAGRLGRHGPRDRTLLLLAYRHGLRVSELVALRWDQVDLKAGLLHVARLKNGLASTHPIRGPELRALRELRRDYPSSPYLFVSELGGPMTPATVRKLITRAGEKAKLPFPIHPHMLRHSTGFKLANDGHDTRSIQQYLGHRNITHTGRYTAYIPQIADMLTREFPGVIEIALYNSRHFLASVLACKTSGPQVGAHDGSRAAASRVSQPRRGAIPHRKTGYDSAASRRGTGCRARDSAQRRGRRDCEQSRARVRGRLGAPRRRRTGTRSCARPRWRSVPPAGVLFLSGRATRSRGLASRAAPPRDCASW